MFAELIKKLKKHRTVGVYSHIRPDGDCIGSQVALCLWLKRNGIEAYAFNDDEVPLNLQWLSDFFPIRHPSKKDFKKCDAFVLVDGNSPSRFGSFCDFIKQHPVPTYMIDHHPDPQDGFTMSVSVEKASSTCELIFHIFLQHDISHIDKKVAQALYTGIITDTGSLQYDSVTPETMNIAAELLRLGDFKPNEVSERVFATRSLNQLHLLSRAMSTIKLYENNQIAIMCVTGEMLEETNTTNDDCEGFVAYPLSVAGIKAAILFKDLGDGIKMSLRSKSDEVDVNKWAREIGGGGHKKASGAWHPGPLDVAVKEVVSVGAKQLVKVDKS